MKKSLNILLTNTYLHKRTWSETYIYTLAHILRDRWHQVSVFCLYGGELWEVMKKEWFRVIYHRRYHYFEYPETTYWRYKSIIIELFKKMERKVHYFINPNWIVPHILFFHGFDIVHFQHQNIIRSLYHNFPSTPKTHVIHGIIPIEEQPFPMWVCPMDSYICVSDEVSRHVSQKWIADTDIYTIYNPIDTQRYIATRQLPKKARSALVISKKIAGIESMLYHIQEACSQANITLTIIWHPHLIVQDTRPYIQDADIVFGIWRCAYEAMSMWRNVIICDYLWLEWIIDSEETFLKLRSKNLSGRYYSYTTFSSDDIYKELLKYNPAYGVLMRNLIIKYHAQDIIWDQIEHIYYSSLES